MSMAFIHPSYPTNFLISVPVKESKRRTEFLKESAATMYLPSGVSIICCAETLRKVLSRSPVVKSQSTRSVQAKAATSLLSELIVTDCVPDSFQS